MEATNVISTSVQLVKGKVVDYGQLMKLRLSFLVVFSATMAYLWAGHTHINIGTLLLVSIGGFLITGAANTLNQVIERESDKLMKRTCDRPLAANRMDVNEALIFATIIGSAGLFLLFNISLLCTALGALAIIMYAAVYTPLKKITPLTVIPGAIAGSMPVVIGCIAAQGRVSSEAILFFMIQFVWQFPHTWSIAWVLNDEYAKAGIHMMPAKSGRSKLSALLILISTALIIPIGLLFYLNNLAGIPEAIIITLAGTGFTFLAYKLYTKVTVKSALGVMFGSFGYLPLVLVVLVITRLFIK